MSAIGTSPLNAMRLAGGLNPQPDGSVTLTINPGTGEVLSVQPDGSWQSRPGGTAGPYELARINGSTITYCPDGYNVFTYAFVQDVPNV